MDQVHYDRYNTRYGADGVHEPLVWDNEEEQIKKFFDEWIFPTIVKTEMTEKSMVNWLETLTLHSFDLGDGVESIVDESTIKESVDIAV